MSFSAQAGDPETLSLPFTITGDFTLVEDVYEELFQLYSESDQSLWKHNHAVKQKEGMVEIEVENVKGQKSLQFTMMQNQSLLSKRGITGSVLWDSSIMLSNMFTQHQKFFGLNSADTQVLELGSGCGLLGITLASLVKQVILTDQYEMLPQLVKNIRRNLGDKSNTEVAELLWGETISKELRKEIVDWVVASDCVYHESLTGKLVKTLSDICQSSDANKVQRLQETGVKATRTCIVLGQELRSDTVHLEFLTSLHEKFVVYRVPLSFVQEDFQNGYCVYFGFLR
ncbi:putative methyltransferase-domain-containing protein [Umbelopsis sp. PMI_123]|jgi:predicted nicotinamide N-methyase|nr:putative methyltransferase-domain-containing protein [Umbelopsis sp. PMI_123]